MDYKSKINEFNIDNVRRQIQKKIGSQPFLANNVDVMGSITDIDHLPYTRWFRGVSYFPDPIIAERQAGYSEIHNDCYEPMKEYVKEQQPDMCYEFPCSTIFPCMPEKDDPYKAREKFTGKNCIIQYR